MFKTMRGAAMLAVLCVAMLVGADDSTLSIRVVTWNVLDNKWMNGAFDKDAVKSILGADETPFPKHDLYAVTVQEVRYKSKSNKQQQLAAVFGDVLGKNYSLANMYATRVSANPVSHALRHGTTAVMVFAREGLLEQSTTTFHVNDCGGSIPNEEKGIAAVRVVVKATGTSVCFAGLHLNWASAQQRRKCVTDFWTEAHDKLGTCNHVVMAGDFNTRPGPKERKGRKEGYRWHDFEESYRNGLWLKDEMSGKNLRNDQQLLDHIEKESGHPLREASVNFLPTYSVLPDAKCKRSSAQSPCYKSSRTPAWTDRILCSRCQPKLYTSLWLGLSDHDPVVGVYELESVGDNPEPGRDEL